MRVGTIPHLQARGSLAVRFRIADRDRLILLQLVERQLGVGTALSVSFFSAVGKATDLVTLVIEEDQPGHRASAD